MRLDRLVLAAARRAVPQGWAAVPIAPETFPALCAAWRAGGRLPVYSGGSDATIYGAPASAASPMIRPALWKNSRAGLDKPSARAHTRTMNNGAPTMKTEDKLATLQPRLDALLTRIAVTGDERDAIGRDLIALKAEYPRGTWTPALRARATEMGVAVRTAQFYMQCAGDQSAQGANVQRQRDLRAAARAAAAAAAAAQTFAPIADPTPTANLLDVAEAFRGHCAAGADMDALAALEILLAASNVESVAGMTAGEITAALSKLIL